ncbi:MAG: class I SAM-dependent methyltransferase [Gammaproteobacteria bacterium]|nr:MAG: class I SAM-dependent methyltransferase [Gammaproteobacteria bacterium]
MKAFSQSCENNKGPILEILRPLLGRRHRLLEIGSGTGQHAAFFAARLPQLLWQTSDVAANRASIEAWIDGVANARPPVVLDVDADDWPARRYDAVFSANTAHIMHWPSVVNMFRGVASILDPGGVFALYGPFNYHGEYTSPGNERFDRTLRATDPGMGVRDFEAVAKLADTAGMTLLADHAMPANNRTLVWARD